MTGVNWRRVLWISIFFFVFYTGGVFAQESLLSTLNALRGEYPAQMSPAQVGELLDRAAGSADGWGLLAKPGGTNCPGPGGVTISCDILLHNPSLRYFDVLVDSDGAAQPIWGAGEPCDVTDGICTGFVAPSAVIPIPGTPVPTPGTPELDALRERVTILEGKVELLAAALASGHQQHAQQIAELRAGVDLLASRPFPYPAYEGKVLGVFPVRVTPGPIR